MFVLPTGKQPLAIGFDDPKQEMTPYQIFRLAHYTAKSLDISYRELNHWSEIGLIEDEREDKENGWRKFTLAGLIWVEVVKELRAFGVGIAAIDGVKKAILEPPEDSSSLNLVEAIALCVSTQKAIFIVVTEDDSKIMYSKEFADSFCKKRRKPFLTIRLDHLLSKLLPALNWEEAEGKASESDKLTAAEKRALEIIRDASFSRVTVFKKNGQIDRLETLKTTDKTHKILELISKLGHGEVTVKIKDGEIAFSEIIEKEKVQ